MLEVVAVVNGIATCPKCAVNIHLGIEEGDEPPEEVGIDHGDDEHFVTRPEEYSERAAEEQQPAAAEPPAAETPAQSEG